MTFLCPCLRSKFKIGHSLSVTCTYERFTNVCKNVILFADDTLINVTVDGVVSLLQNETQ